MVLHAAPEVTGCSGSRERGPRPVVAVRLGHSCRLPYHGGVPSPSDSETWIDISPDPLPVAAVNEWASVPSCGAVVTFVGTARDHSVGRPGVTRLDFEAYEEQVVAVLASVADDARGRWPDLGRLALLHRVGRVDLGEAAVVVAASAPHRDAAFDAARFGIDELKARAPIWKREAWAEGTEWALDPQHVATSAETRP